MQMHVRPRNDHIAPRRTRLSSTLSVRGRPNFIHPAAIANKYRNDRGGGMQPSRTGYGRIDSRFPKPTPITVTNRHGIEYSLKELRDLDTLSSKVFIHGMLILSRTIIVWFLFYIIFHHR